VAALRDAGLTAFADDGAGTRVKKTDPDATATAYAVRPLHGKSCRFFF
jgi:hypothetical protein